MKKAIFNLNTKSVVYVDLSPLEIDEIQQKTQQSIEYEQTQKEREKALNDLIDEKIQKDKTQQ